MERVIGVIKDRKGKPKEMKTYERKQPWIIYRYGRTHDGYWPFWTSTHFLGRFCVEATCAVCGVTEEQWMKIPRFAEIEDKGPHPRRVQFCVDHLHPDKGAPMSWAKPLLNPFVEIVLDLLAMRLEADMNEGRT